MLPVRHKTILDAVSSSEEEAVNNFCEHILMIDDVAESSGAYKAERLSLILKEIRKGLIND